MKTLIAISGVPRREGQRLYPLLIDSIVFLSENNLLKQPLAIIESLLATTYWYY